MQRGSAGGDADRVFAALPLGEALLKFHATLSGPVIDLPGAQHLFDGPNRLFIEVWPAYEFVCDGFGPAIEGEGFKRVGTVV